jgi:hypothetical protein
VHLERLSVDIEQAHAERASALLGPSRAPAIAVDLLACK